MHYPKPFEELIKHFASLPSVGQKMAERIVLHLFKKDHRATLAFAQSLQKITQLKLCGRCFHVCEKTLCDICQDSRRDPFTLCVVEDPIDVISIERSGSYGGMYHVLGGMIEIGTRNNYNQQENLTVPELLRRVREELVQEVILATNPTAEGDLTALYLKRKLQPLGVKITRLGRGLSTGSDIEYADEETLSASLTNRKEIG